MATHIDTPAHVPSQPAYAVLVTLRHVDAIGDDYRLAQAARLAVWGAAEAGENDELAAVHALLRQLEDRLEERVREARTIHEGRRTDTGPTGPTSPDLILPDCATAAQVSQRQERAPMPSSVAAWAATFLIEERRWMAVYEDDSPEGKAECDRARRMQDRAMEELTKQRSETLADLSGKIAVALDWMACDGFEHTLAILNAVQADLRAMELLAKDEAGPA